MSRDASPTPAGLPPAVVYAFALTPIVAEPIVNADFFHEAPAQLLLEVLGNYVPAAAILAGLWLVHRSLAASRGTDVAMRTATSVLVAAVVAALASVLVHPLHLALVAETDAPLSVYLQRNVGWTCMIVLPIVLLEEHRARAAAAERRLVDGQRRALRGQLELLRSRTQPHFLFNVLNTIASLVRDDVELAERTIHRLAEILRHALESSRAETMPLSRELEIVVAYLEVQSARFGPRLRYALDVAPQLGALAIPPFVLQPLVENAVVHAVAARVGGGTIVIRATRVGDRIVLGVEDDGPGPGASTHRGTRTGLDDLRERLALLHGGAATLVTRGNVRGGFTAELELPAREDAP